MENSLAISPSKWISIKEEEEEEKESEKIKLNKPLS